MSDAKMAARETIRVLIADSQSLFREAVRAQLQKEPDIDVVAEAADGLQAVAESERCRPDVAIVDPRLPKRDGIRVTAMIRQSLPESRVVVLAHEEAPEELASAIEAGASGYVAKEAPLAELLEAARAVHRGETIVPPRLLGSLLDQLIERRRAYDQAFRKIAKLTAREREVVALLVEGADNHAIAAALAISPQTARTHVQNVLMKLEMHSRLEVVAFVMRSGILQELQPQGEPIVPKPNGSRLVG